MVMLFALLLLNTASHATKDFQNDISEFEGAHSVVDGVDDGHIYVAKYLILVESNLILEDENNSNPTKFQDDVKIFESRFGNILDDYLPQFAKRFNFSVNLYFIYFKNEEHLRSVIDLSNAMDDYDYVMSIANSDSVEYINEFVQETVPHIVITEKLGKRSYQRNVFVIPHLTSESDVLTRLFIDLKETKRIEGWESFDIVYDESNDTRSMDSCDVRRYGKSGENNIRYHVNGTQHASVSCEISPIQTFYDVMQSNGRGAISLINLTQIRTDREMMRSQFNHTSSSLSNMTAEIKRKKQDVDQDSLVTTAFSLPHDKTIGWTSEDHLSLKRAAIDSVLRQLGSRVEGERSSKILFVVSKNDIPTIIESIRKYSLAHVDSQFIFVISDTSNGDLDVLAHLTTARDGENFSFITNMSETKKMFDKNLCGSQYEIENAVDKVFTTSLTAMEIHMEKKKDLTEEEIILRNTFFNRRDSYEFLDSLKSVILSELSFDRECSMWKVFSNEYFGPSPSIQVLGEKTSKMTSNLLYVGFWNMLVGFQTHDDIFPHITGGMRKRTVYVTAAHDPPWSIIERVIDNTGDVPRSSLKYDGLVFKILDELSISLNFTYEVFEPDFEAYFDERDAYNRLVEIVREDDVVMIGAGRMSITDERLKEVEFTIPFIVDYYTFIYQKSVAQSRAFLFVLPFTPLVWVFLSISLVMIGPILWVIHELNQQKLKSKNEKNKENISKSFSGNGDDQKSNDSKNLTMESSDYFFGGVGNCMWYCYGAVVQQGGTVMPESTPGRVIIAFWWIFVLICAATYSGNLVAILTSPSLESRITTVNQLIKAGKDEGMVWYYQNNSSLQNYLATSNEKRFEELYDKGRVYTNVREMEELISELNDRSDIRNSERVLISDLTSLQNIMSQSYLKTKQCQFSIGQELFFGQRIAFAFPKKSPWIGKFNKIIQRMLYAGLIKKWQEQFWSKENECSNTRRDFQSSNITITVSDMQGAFWVLFIGGVVSLTAILSETISHYTSNKRNENNVQKEKRRQFSRNEE